MWPLRDFLLKSLVILVNLPGLNLLYCSSPKCWNCKRNSETFHRGWWIYHIFYIGSFLGVPFLGLRFLTSDGPLDGPHKQYPKNRNLKNSTPSFFFLSKNQSLGCVFRVFYDKFNAPFSLASLTFHLSISIQSQSAPETKVYSKKRVHVKETTRNPKVISTIAAGGPPHLNTEGKETQLELK